MAEVVSLDERKRQRCARAEREAMAHLKAAKLAPASDRALLLLICQSWVAYTCADSQGQITEQAEALRWSPLIQYARRYLKPFLAPSLPGDAS